MIVAFFIIASIFVLTGYGNVVDVEYTPDFLDLFGVHVETSPNNPFDFDVVPPIAATSQNQFILRFRVRSGADTHVALSTNGRQEMYDIVFGRNRNRYAAVSQCSYSGCNELGAVIMRDAVSFYQIQDLWIGYDYAQGIIQVGRGADSIPRLEVVVPTPLSLAELGFSTSGGTEGYWWLPDDYLVQSCGSLLYETDGIYSHRYTLPVIPRLSSRDFEFDFYVVAPADVRILLASEVELSDDEPAYEIVIGSASNTESEIRRCKLTIECCPSIASAQTPQILSEVELEKFTIRYNYGLLKVFSGDEEMPFLSVLDPSPISIRTIAYSTGPNNGGVFEFPSKGITSGLLTFDTEANSPFNLDLPLVPEEKAYNVDLTFLVKAEKSVVIVFSPVTNINEYSGLLYEIVIGGWNDEGLTTISLCSNCGTSASVEDHQPLNQNEFRRFRITFYDGNINLFEDRRDQPTLYFQDPNPQGVGAVGFTTRDGATGRFVFSTCNLY